MSKQYFITSRVVIYEAVTNRIPKIMTPQLFLLRSSLSTRDWELYGVRRLPIARTASNTFSVSYFPIIMRTDSDTFDYATSSEILDPDYFYFPIVHKEDLIPAIILGLPCNEKGIYVFNISLGEDLNSNFSEVYKHLISSAKQYTCAADAVFFNRFLKSTVREDTLKEYMEKTMKDFRK